DRDNDRDADGVADEASAAMKPDDPGLRAMAMNDWYTESPTVKGEEGIWSREYRAYLLDVARAERLRWPNLMPGAQVQDLIGGSQWNSIGPTDSHSSANGGGGTPVVDSARIKAGRPPAPRLHRPTSRG